MTGSWHQVILNLRRLVTNHIFGSNIHKGSSKFSGNSPLYSRFEHLRTTEHSYYYNNKSLLKLSKNELVPTMIEFISSRSFKRNND